MNDGVSRGKDFLTIVCKNVCTLQIYAAVTDKRAALTGTPRPGSCVIMSAMNVGVCTARFMFFTHDSIQDDNYWTFLVDSVQIKGSSGGFQAQKTGPSPPTMRTDMKEGERCRGCAFFCSLMFIFPPHLSCCSTIARFTPSPELWHRWGRPFCWNRDSFFPRRNVSDSINHSDVATVIRTCT